LINKGMPALWLIQANDNDVFWWMSLLDISHSTCSILYGIDIIRYGFMWNKKYSSGVIFELYFEP
jgi:hypothetical protein